MGLLVLSLCLCTVVGSSVPKPELSGVQALGSGFPHKIGVESRVLGKDSRVQESRLSGAVRVRGGQEAQNSWRGVVCVLGGLMTHLALGTMYCWGNLVTYTPASLKYWDGQDHPGQPLDSLIALPLIICGQMCGMPFGPWLESFLGPRITGLIGACFVGGGVFLSSFMTRLLPFLLCYSIMFGIGVGISYQMATITGVRWFPSKKGLVNGAVISALGVSAFLFNIIGTSIVNPEGLKMVNGAFPAGIYAKWPGLLRKLAVIYFGLTATGALVQANPKTFVRPAKGVVDPSAYTVAEGVKTPQFWMMWLMIFGCIVSSLNLAGSYKAYGVSIPELNDDKFQSMVGGIAALGNCAGRFFWAGITDSVPFNKAFAVLSVVQAACMLTYTKMASLGKAAFIFSTVVMLSCMGGTFAMMPAQAMRMFGSSGAAIYGVMFSAFGCAGLVGPLIGKKIQQMGGWSMLFTVLGLFTFLSTSMALSFKPLLPKSLA